MLRNSAARWFGIAVLSLMSCGGTQAQLNINPTVKDFGLPARGHGSYSLHISNSTKAAYDCVIRISDLALTPEGRPQAAEAPNNRGCSSWMTANPSSFRLPPGATREVTISLMAPAGKEGAFSAYIDCVAEAIGAPRDAKLLRHAMLGSALITHVNGPGRTYVQLQVKSFKISAGSGSARDMRPWGVIVDAVNTGNGMDYVSGLAEVHELGGTLVGKAPLASGMGTMLPDMPRQFSATGAQALRDGPYIVSFKLLASRGVDLYRDLAYIIVKAGKVETAKPTPEAISAMQALVPRLRIDPPSLDLSVAPRGRTSSYVTITNQVTEPLPVTLGVMSWQTGKSGERELCTGKEQPRDASRWIHLDRSEVIVPPGGNARVRATVAVPQDATGERYFAIVATPKGQTTAPSLDDAVVAAVSAKGTIAESAAIPQFVALRQSTGGYKFQLTISNTGNARIWIGGSIRVTGAANANIGSAVSLAEGDVMVMPGTTRVVSVDWPQVLRPGTYVATATLSYGEGKRMNGTAAISEKATTTSTKGAAPKMTPAAAKAAGHR